MFKVKNGYLLISCISLFMLCASFATFGTEAFADKKTSEDTIKTVILKTEPSGITPNPLNVKLGTTIVWFNSDPEPVTIKFIDKLGIACKAPVNFYADLFGHYETGSIPQGGTASICFIYKGDYTYEVKRLIDEKGKQTEQITTGMITAVEP
jgi:hypothetical protein